MASPTPTPENKLHMRLAKAETSAWDAYRDASLGAKSEEKRRKLFQEAVKKTEALAQYERKRKESGQKAAA